MKIDSNTIRAISDFIFVSDNAVKSDLIIVPGSSHEELPLKAMYLFKKGYGNKIIFTGGFNEKLKKNESDWELEIAVKKKINPKNIFCENNSTNTKENAIEAMKLIKKEKLPLKTLLIVSKAYHARRVKMTFSKIFKNSEIRIIPVMDIRKISKENTSLSSI